MYTLQVLMCIHQIILTASLQGFYLTTTATFVVFFSVFDYFVPFVDDSFVATVDSQMLLQELSQNKI